MTPPLIITKLMLERAARKAGCCREYRWLILRAKNRDELIDIYTKGVRFCMQRDYPSIATINRHFAKEHLNRRGMYIGDNLEGREQQHRTIVARGYCKGRLHYGETRSHRLVATDNSHFDISVDGFAILMLDILGNAEVTLRIHDHARVIVYHYDSAPAPKILAKEDTASLRITHRTIPPINHQI